MLVSFQAIPEIQNLVDHTLKLPEDASERKITSRKLILGSNQKSKCQYSLLKNMSHLIIYKIILINNLFIYSFLTEQRHFDKTRPTYFRGYGKETLLKPHEAIGEQWSTTFRKTYLDPNNRAKPNAH